jgi:starch phosphorylase
MSRRPAVIIPGSDLSEQISTAGTEASGTGNMKFALNGALTSARWTAPTSRSRTRVGEDNIFIFGLNAEEAEHLHLRGSTRGATTTEMPS